MMNYYYSYFKSFVKTGGDVVMKELREPELEEQFAVNTEPENLEQSEVVFARAPEQIKARKQSSESVSAVPTAKRSRPSEEANKLKKKYPALKKF